MAMEERQMTTGTAQVSWLGCTMKGVYAVGLLW